MKRWIAPLASLVAVAGVAALALFFAGVFDGNDASGSGGNGPEVAGDTGFVTDDDGGDTVAPGCALGEPLSDCADYTGWEADDKAPTDPHTFEGDGPVIQPVCAPGFPDCADTLVLTDDDEIDIGRFDEDNATSGSDDAPIAAE